MDIGFAVGRSLRTLRGICVRRLVPAGQCFHEPL